MANERFIIEPLASRDFKALYALTERGLPVDHWSIGYLWQEYQKSPANFSVVKNDLVIGGVMAQMGPAIDIGRIVILVVNSNYQRMGFGRMLLERGIDDLCQKGARKVQLSARVTNAPMIGLARKVGFTECGISYFCYKDGASGQNMELILNERP